MYTKSELRNNNRPLLRRLQRQLDNANNSSKPKEQPLKAPIILKNSFICGLQDDGFDSIDLDENKILRKTTRLSLYNKRGRR